MYTSMVFHVQVHEHGGPSICTFTCGNTRVDRVSTDSVVLWAVAMQGPPEDSSAAHPGENVRAHPDKCARMRTLRIKDMKSGYPNVVPLSASGCFSSRFAFS